MPLMQRFRQDRGTARRDPLQPIVDNLNNVLNSRKEFSSLIAEIGVSDPNRYAGKESAVKELIDQIKDCVALCEPRVLLIDIKQIPAANDLFLRLEMTCQILDRKKPLYVTIRSLSDLTVERG